MARNGDVNNVMSVAKDYFPTVINQIKVGGGQTVAIQVKVYEVSRTKLRELGVDFSAIGQDLNIISGFSDLITNFADGSATNLNYRLGIFGDDTNINFIVKALEQRNIAKLLDEPTLTAENGRPAEFLSGGEIPIQVASGFGNNSIEFRAFGTKLDMVSNRSWPRRDNVGSSCRSFRSCQRSQQRHQRSWFPRTPRQHRRPHACGTHVGSGG